MQLITWHNACHRLAKLCAVGHEILMFESAGWLGAGTHGHVEHHTRNSYSLSVSQRKHTFKVQFLLNLYFFCTIIKSQYFKFNHCKLGSISIPFYWWNRSNVFLVTYYLEKWLITFGHWNLEIINLFSAGINNAHGKWMEHSKRHNLPLRRNSIRRLGFLLFLSVILHAYTAGIHFLSRWCLQSKWFESWT